ncbi:MAG: hypothetical protein EPN23_10520 [Verrucomicrobia bacterium]|nr:MAG: hypothetical protein EPN23_10520 [Verrucomicrobiota bacterium]
MRNNKVVGRRRNRKTEFMGAVLLALGITGVFAAPQEGNLVKSGQSGIYLIKDGKRCVVPSAKTFLASGFKWENVTTISDEALNAIPVGAVLLAPYKTPQDGDLVQGCKSGIYLIKDGKRCVVPSAAAFLANGFKQENVIKISDEDLNAIPVGPVLPTPYKTPKDGDLIKGSGAGVYVIKDGKRSGIESAEQFKALGYKWEKVLQISDEDLAAIPEG